MSTPNSNSGGGGAGGSGGGGSGGGGGGSGAAAGTFVDRIDPFAKRSLKKKQKKSQGSSRYRTGGDQELQALPSLKGENDQSNRIRLDSFVIGIIKSPSKTITRVVEGKT